MNIDRTLTVNGNPSPHSLPGDGFPLPTVSLLITACGRCRDTYTEDLGAHLYPDGWHCWPCIDHIREGAAA